MMRNLIDSLILTDSRSHALRGNAVRDALRRGADMTQSVRECVPTQSVGTRDITLSLLQRHTHEFPDQLTRLRVVEAHHAVEAGRRDGLAVGAVGDRVDAALLALQRDGGLRIA